MNLFFYILFGIALITSVAFSITLKNVMVVSSKYDSPEIIPFKINIESRRVTLLNKTTLFRAEIYHEYESFVSYLDTHARAELNRIINTLKEDTDYMIENKRIEVKIKYDGELIPYFLVIQNVNSALNELCGYFKYEPITSTNTYYDDQTTSNSFVPNKEFDKSVIEFATKNGHKKHVMMLIKIAGIEKLSDVFDANIAEAIKKETYRKISTVVGNKAIASITKDSQIWLYRPTKTMNRVFQKSSIRKLYRKLANLKLQDAIRVQTKMVTGVSLFYGNINPESIKKMKSLSLFSLVKSSNSGLSFDIFSAADSPEYSKKIELVGSIDNALKKNKVEVSYQPMYDLRTAKLIGYTTTSTLSDVNVPINAIEELTNIYIGSTRFNNTLIKAIVDTTYDSKTDIYINSSASSMYNNLKDFEDIFESINKKIHVLELTNTRELSPYQLVSLCKKLQELKIRYCIDNYDINQDSIASVALYKPESIKISKITNNIHLNEENLIKAIDYIKFCDSQGVDIIATKVENEFELYVLSNIGVNKAEGYYIGKPNKELTTTSKEVVQHIKQIREG